MSGILRSFVMFENITFQRLPSLNLQLPERWFQVLERIRAAVDLEPNTIVEWMRESRGHYEQLLTMAADYPASGIQVVAGDAWSPGMTISEYFSIGQTGQKLSVFKNPKVAELVAEVEMFKKKWDSYKQLLIMYLGLVGAKQNQAIFNFFDKFARLPSAAQVRIPTFPALDGKTLLTPSIPYSFQLVRPALKTVFSFDAQIPEETKVKVNLWDAGRNTIAESSEVVLPPGGHTVVATFRNPLMAGHVEIDPILAPEGLTIANIRSSPTSI
jgi:hypothetical protein